MPIPEKIEIKQLDLELNGGCNYKCPMCPQAEGREKNFLKKLPYHVFTKIVDDAMQYGLDTVSLHGSGEPTLNRDMPKFVKYVKNKGIKCLSFTNGFRLTKNMSRELIRVEGVDRSFGPVTVLQDINIMVNEGDRIGIVGHNGAGKTTLLNTISEQKQDVGDIEFASGINGNC